MRIGLETAHHRVRAGGPLLNSGTDWTDRRIRPPDPAMNSLSRKVLEIDAKLLALLVEVASFEP